MKILEIANGDFFSTYGGGQVYVKTLIDEMIHQGFDVTVISFVNKKNEEITESGYKGIPVFEVSYPDKNAIRKIVKQVSPDIIHIHSQKALFAELSKELSIMSVVTAHHGGVVCPAGTLMNSKDEICSGPFAPGDCLRCVLKNIKAGLLFYPFLKTLPLSIQLKLGYILKKLPFIYFVTPIGSSSLHIENKKKEWQTIINNVDWVIAPSEFIAKSMEKQGLKTEKIKLVPHGIPVENILDQGPIVDISGKVVKFFYVGRICYVKGIHILLEAFSHLDKNNCELHLIGDIQGDYQRKLIKKYGKEKNIFFHGKINPEKVRGYIKEFDVLVHPAIYLEVFGLNIGEALIAGKPVIATRCGGAEMQINHGENGLLVEPNQSDVLKDAMNWMMTYPEKVSEMSRKAPLRVITMEQYVKNLNVLFENLHKQTI